MRPEVASRPSGRSCPCGWERYHAARRRRALGERDWGQGVRRDLPWKQEEESLRAPTRLQRPEENSPTEARCPWRAEEPLARVAVSCPFLVSPCSAHHELDLFVSKTI